MDVRLQTRAGRRLPWLRDWAGGILLLAALATVYPAATSFAQDGSALETVHEISWLHSSPSEVSSFVLFLSPPPGSMEFSRQINVGKPGGSNSDSVQFFSALVPVGIDEMVAVAAIGQNGLRSGLSQWRRAQPSRPGQPLVVEP